MTEISVRFRPQPDTDLVQIEVALDSLRPIVDHLGKLDKTLTDWYLAGGQNAEESRRYKVFDAGINGHDSAISMLKQQFKNGDDFIVLWNGYEESDVGAQLSLSIKQRPPFCRFTLTIGSRYGQCRIGGYQEVAELLAIAARQYKPMYAHVYEPVGYKLVFQDRPGVGWMAYMPRILIEDQVTHAGALIPVMDGKDRLGTIIVSVVDEVFNETNPAHTNIAHAIEIELVEQDLLPLNMDLLMPPD